MKYEIIETLYDSLNVITTMDDENFVSFPAIAGNSNYDQFLVQVDLTDEGVHALPLNEWIEV